MAIKKQKYVPIENFERTFNPIDEDWNQWIQQVAQVGAWTYNANTEEGWWSDGVYRILDLEPGTIIDNPMKFYVESDQKKILDAMADALQNQKSWDFTVHLTSAKGHKKWARSIGQPVERDGVLIIKGLFQDVTKEFLANRDLRYQASIFKNAQESIITVNRDGIVTTWNPHAEKMYGWTSHDAVGRHISFIVPKWTKESTAGFLRKILDENGFQGEFDRETKYGDIIRVQASFFPVYDDNGDLLMISSFSRDISESKEMEKQIVHTAKLASIGELAAGVGHEINNPLAIIFGYNNRLIKNVEDDIRDCKKCTLAVNRIKTSSERIASIVKSLKNYARVDEDEIVDFDIHKTIEEATQLVESMYQKEGVNIIKRFNVENAVIRGNANKLVQVFMNLITNAKDALKNRRQGEITFETSEDKAFIYINVSDNGEGIDHVTKKHIFETFYTTKPKGRGTGLGLSISSKIIQEHNGSIEVESEQGFGTTFKIKVPKVGSANVVEIQKSEPMKMFSGNVLVVDDEIAIQEHLKIDLESMGFSVMTAGNVQDAVRILKTHEVELLITDLMMPEETGVDLLKRIKQKTYAPKRILVMTGGLVTDYTKAERRFIRMNCDGYLQKPFTFEEIYNSVSNAA